MSNIAVIGATGMVGSRVVAEAAARGNHVDAYSRTGNAPASANITPYTVDFTNTQAVVEIINAHDATLITVAGRDNYDAVREAHHALIEAAPKGRFIVVGGAGALMADEHTRLVDTPGFPDAYKPEALTFAAVYEDYRLHATHVQWSMIAPAPEIAPGVRTGNIVISLNTPAGGFVSAEDFADAVVNELEMPQHIGERFTVASADERAARA